VLHRDGLRTAILFWRQPRELRVITSDPRSPTDCGDRGFPAWVFNTPSQDLQLFQTSNGIRTGRCGFDLAINIKKFPVFSYVKRPALRDCPSFVHHTIGLGDFLTWIAEDRIVNTKRFSESLVLFRRICAGGKVGDIGVLERFAILTE
jgi:hypothetical protein